MGPEEGLRVRLGAERVNATVEDAMTREPDETTAYTSLVVAVRVTPGGIWPVPSEVKVGEPETQAVVGLGLKQ